MNDIDNPLTETQKSEINAVLDTLPRVKNLIDKAKRADLPVEEMERTVLEKESQLRKIKQNFFPNG